MFLSSLSKAYMRSGRTLISNPTIKAVIIPSPKPIKKCTEIMAIRTVPTGMDIVPPNMYWSINAIDEKTTTTALKYHKIRKVEKKDIATVIWLKDVPFPFVEARPPEDGMGWESVEQALNEGYHVGLNNMIYMDKVVITAVEGACAGIGCAYYLSSDIAVMAKSSFFQIGFSKIALIPDGGSNWLLTKVVGYQQAFRMAAEAKRVSAEECQSLGMCSEVCEDGSALETAMELAKHYAELAPRAVFKTKHLMRDSFNKSYEQNLKDEAKTQEDMVGRNDNIEGVTAFVEKRKPNFTGE